MDIHAKKKNEKNTLKKKKQLVTTKLFDEALQSKTHVTGDANWQLVNTLPAETGKNDSVC